MLTIGVDVGSTSVKAVLYGGDGPLRVASSLLDARIQQTPAGFFEEDPQQVAAATERVIREVADPEVKAICFTGQMHGGLLTDARNRPLTPLITWQDRRSEAVASNLRSRVPARVWEGVGTTIHAGFLGATARWLLGEGAVEGREWRLLGLIEWTACRVLGIEPYTDPSGGAAWGLYDIRAGRWSEAILEACEIPTAALPRVVDSGQPVGTVSAEAARILGLPEGVTVISGTGDTQASYIGSGCRPKELLVNFGTGSQLLWETSTFQQWPATDTRALPGGRFLISLSTLAGGGAYARLADFLADVLRTLASVDVDRDELFERMNEAARSAPMGSEGVVASPLFNGSRWLGESLRASISGLSGHSFTTANVCRAMLEGVVEELAAPYFAIPPEPRDHERLVASGNGMRRNTLLRGIVGQRFGLPLRLSPHEEEAAFGAARLAAGEFVTFYQ